MQAKKLPPKSKTKTLNLPLLNPNAAGIDVGDLLLVVAVPQDRDDQPVREFGAFTSDLHDIARWLKDCKIDTVAIESTGIYWKNLYTILTQYGFEVCLVNARYTKNVSGRKTDESDAQWIQRLHSCGLLRNCFLPDDLTQTLRALVRQRRSLIQDSTRYVLRLQKALELMNLKIHAVISDITGTTGTKIVEAIIAGERSPENFLPLMSSRIKADKETLLKSLQGNWRTEYLFLLEQSYNMYLYLQKQIAVCDKQIEQALQSYSARENDGELVVSENKTAKLKHRKQPKFDTRAYLHKIHRVDVIDIYGISEIAALEILSETGTNLAKWHSEKHFVSWLNLCPNNKISGGKLISSEILRKKPNAAAQAFKAAANGICRSDNWLGDYFRRMKAKGGQKYAIVATARKLAIIYYKMVRYKQVFKPFDNDEYKTKYQQVKIAYLERALARLKATAA